MLDGSIQAKLPGHPGRKIYPGKTFYSLALRTLKCVSRQTAVSGQVYPGRKLDADMNTSEYKLISIIVHSYKHIYINEYYKSEIIFMMFGPTVILGQFVFGVSIEVLVLSLVQQGRHLVTSCRCRGTRAHHGLQPAAEG